MIKEKIQCFFFERKINNFLWKLERLKYLEKEEHDCHIPKFKNGIISCIDMFKQENSKRNVQDKLHKILREQNRIKEEIRSDEFNIFYDIPYNFTVLTKNYEIKKENLKTEYSLKELLMDEKLKSMFVRQKNSSSSLLSISMRATFFLYEEERFIIERKTKDIKFHKINKFIG